MTDALRSVLTILVLLVGAAGAIVFSALGNSLGAWVMIVFVGAGQLAVHSDRLVYISLSMSGLVAQLEEAKRLAKEAEATFEQLQEVGAAVTAMTAEVARLEGYFGSWTGARKESVYRSGRSVLELIEAPASVVASVLGPLRIEVAHMYLDDLSYDLTSNPGERSGEMFSTALSHVKKLKEQVKAESRLPSIVEIDRVVGPLELNEERSKTVNRLKAFVRHAQSEIEMEARDS